MTWQERSDRAGQLLTVAIARQLLSIGTNELDSVS
jgi:hypothetical protein